MVNDAPVAPLTGLVMMPDDPAYHWNVGAVPEAAAVNVAVAPLLTVTGAGWVVIAGGMITVALAVLEFAVPAALVARTQ